MNYGKGRVALLLGGSITEIPSGFVIGTGSASVLATDTSLITVADGQALTGSDISTIYKIKFTGDWTSTEMSGLSLTEYGIKSGVGLTGSLWSRNGFAPITFDGNTEMRIEEVWQIY